MAIKATVNVGRWPSSISNATVMRAIGEVCKAQVVQRTFREGRGLDDNPHKRYSTKPLSVYLGSETARRLKPKGGVPLYRKRRYKARGKSQSTYLLSWKHYDLGALIGRRYEGGYKQFKTESRKGLNERSVEVDLVLSGQLSRSLRVVRVQRTSAVVQVQGGSLKYAAGVNARRPWMGMSTGDINEARFAVAAVMLAYLEDQTGGRIA
tara:strand:+ start:3237 stop:3860 length:624 start_codon:yes stop_codon:yes gene_type:complete